MKKWEEIGIFSVSAKSVSSSADHEIYLYRNPVVNKEVGNNVFFMEVAFWYGVDDKTEKNKIKISLTLLWINSCWKWHEFFSAENKGMNTSIVCSSGSSQL